MRDIDTCLICGKYVPEGRQVCFICEKRVRTERNDDVFNIYAPDKVERKNNNRSTEQNLYYLH